MLKKQMGVGGGGGGGRRPPSGAGGHGGGGGGGLPVGTRDELLCRNGCGFFGNPEWQWYCSKCWREHQQKGPATHKGASTAGAPRASREKEQQHSSSSRKRFSKLSSPKFSSSPRHLAQQQQQQQQHPESHPEKERNFKLFGKSGPAAKQEASGGKLASSSLPSSSDLVEVKAISDEFREFLNSKLGNPAVVDISRRLKAFVDSLVQFCSSGDWETDEQGVVEVANMAQEFYLNLRKHLQTSVLYQGLSDDDQSCVLDWSERYALVFCHGYLFCPPTTDDESKDLQIQSRIRRLNWISPKHLGCEIDESSQEVRDVLHDAINNMLEMDGKPSPAEKLEAVVLCCKCIFELLRASTGQPASADEFLPCLIYVLLKSNPPRLHSNINFISRFRNEEKLRMGEAGYFFANLCCAVSFVESLNAESIGMESDEFESYLSGRVVPPGSWQSSLLMCESLQVMAKDVKMLADIRNRQEKLFKAAVDLQASMETFQSELRAEVQEVLDRTQYQIREAPKKKAILGEGSPPRPDLPEPLVPESLSSSSTGTAAAAAPVTPSSLSSSAQQPDAAAAAVSPPSSGSSSSPAKSMTSTTASANPDLSLYKGFSAQRFDIPNISCSNVVGGAGGGEQQDGGGGDDDDHERKEEEE